MAGLVKLRRGIGVMEKGLLWAVLDDAAVSFVGGAAIRFRQHECPLRALITFVEFGVIVQDH